MLTRRSVLGLTAGVATAAVASPTHAAIVPTRDIAHTVRTWGPAVVIGDSLTTDHHDLAVALAIHDVGPFRIDAKAGRAINKRAASRFDTGRERVLHIRAQGLHVAAWWIGLAGNDFERYQRGTTTPGAEISSLLDLLGPDAMVAWPTVWRTKSEWQPVCERFNDDLHQLSASWPNLHVVEWAELASEHRNWFRDGVHLRGEGLIARHRMTAETIRSMCEAGRVGPE